MSKGAPDYSKITLIKGAAPDGSLVTIAVDSSGQILAVLKGDYLGTPTTIAVDAAGHMLANIYDPDDLFGNTGYIGLAELAARLGSPVCFDRRGQIVWWDDFENAPLKWGPFLSGTGAAVALDTTNSFLKGQSVKLTAGTTASMYGHIRKLIPFVAQNRVGFEATICLSTGLEPTDIQFFLTHQTATTSSNTILKWDIVNHKLYLWNLSGTWTEIVSAYSPDHDNFTWFKFKFVVDFSTGYYQRVMYGNQVFDASAIKFIAYTGTYSPGLYVHVRNTGSGDTNRICWVDDVVITTNEP
jgi:hypothetical protein